MSNKQKVKSKRLLSLLLALTMVLGMLPIMGTTTALAYTGDGNGVNYQSGSVLTPIKSIVIKGIVTPVYGKMASTNYINTTTEAKVTEIKWESVNDSSWNWTTDKFVSGDRYKIIITLDARDGYYFVKPAIEATINGHTATIVSVDEDILEISYVFQCPNTTKIKNINFYGVTEPVTGETPDFSDPPVLQSNSVTIKGVRWFYVKSNSSGDLSTSSKFSANMTYKIDIEILPKEGYEFLDPSEMTATINGKTAKFYKVINSDNYAVTYTFPKTKYVLSAITIEDVTKPVAGAKPDFAVSALDAGVEVDWVTWRDLGASSSMGENDVFEAGRTYELTVKLKMSETYAPYQFADEADSFVHFKYDDAGNFDSGIVSGDSKTEKTVSITYYCPGKKIGYVGIADLQTPKEGNAIDMDIYQNETPHAQIYDFWWVDNTEGNNNLPAGTKFVAGHDYSLVVYIKPDTGYYFERISESDNTYTGTVSVNGDAVTFSDGNKPFVYFTNTGEVGSNCLVVVLNFSIKATVAKPVITTQPKPASALIGSSMSFSVTATGATGYNWYVYDEGDAQPYSWGSIKQHAAVSGENTSKITITPTDTWLNGKVIGCDVKNSGGTVYTNCVKITVTTPVAEGATVSGTVKSFGSDTDDVMIQLIEQGFSEAAYETVVNGKNASYSIGKVASGTYKMKVMKKNHATREYTVNVSGDNLIQNAEIYLLGDVNMDGKISIFDATEIQMSLAGISTLDEYQTKLADVIQDSNVSIFDATQIQLYIAGIIDEL